MRHGVAVSGKSSDDGGSGDGSASDDGVSHDHESDASESSGDDGDAGRGGLVDLEAEESGDDEASDGWESRTENASDDGNTQTFHSFMKLPLELRYRIWEAFCPDLVAKGRLLQFDMWARDTSRHASNAPRRRVWTVREWVTLPDQTESLRRVMAAHQESRTMALKVFPDTLSIDSGSGDALVHFNRHDDVVLFNGLQRYAANDKHRLPGFADRVRNVAVLKWNSPNDELAPEYVRMVIGNLPNLQRIYFHQDERIYKDRDIRWCVSGYAHQYTTETFEKQPGLGENTRAVACWPDVDNHSDFAKYQIPRVHLEGRPSEIEQMLEERGIEAYPMVLFEFEEALERYRWLHETKHIPNCEELVSGFYDPSSGSEEESEEEDEEDEDEYESDGIDDAEIIEADLSSEDEIIPTALSDGYSSSVEGGASARFSSLDPRDNDHDDDDKSEGVAPMPQPRATKRRIVADSDDDEHAQQDAPRVKRARTGRAIMVDSDDDEGAGSRTMPVVTIPDSESDDDGGGARAAATNSESNTSEDKSDESDGSPPKQRLSLAERLRMCRGAIPVASSDEECGSTDNDEEDEEDDDVDEDEDEDGSGDGFIDGIAAESDGEGEDESDDGW